MESRWLLPFTFGIDHRAIETVVRLAKASGAIVVPVALISVSSGRRSLGARLEHVQQAQDFLMLAQSIAARHQVLTECHQVFTGAVDTRIRMLVQDLCCESVVVVISAHLSVLLQTHEMSSLLIKPPASLVLLRLPADRHHQHLGKRFLSWLYELWKWQGTILQEQSTSPKDQLSQINVPEHSSK